MAWTYGGDPTKSAKDETRFLCGDTDSQDPLLQDGEITYLLAKYNNSPLNAAIRACEAIMSKFARLADETVGSVHISYSQKRKGYEQMRLDLQRRLAMEDASPYAGGISRSDKTTQEENTDRVKPDFTKHQNENHQVAPLTTNQGLLSDLGIDESE